jgi:DNA-binding NarL/FixJ family response regulator
VTRSPRAHKPRLLIADHAPTRLAIRVALGDTVHVCDEAQDAAHAIAGAKRERPDVCLIGLEVPGGGIAATTGIREASPDSAVIVLATTPDADDLLACVQAGAVGYLASDISAAGLRRSVASVQRGEAAAPRSMVLALMRELQESGAPFGHDGLTAREYQVLGMLRKGQSTSAIAEGLGISPVTVRRHISTTMQKIGVEDRSALAQVTLDRSTVGGRFPPERGPTDKAEHRDRVTGPLRRRARV